jgi:hypothetical protein
MSKQTATEVVQAWQEALNLEDRERVLQLSHPNIEIVGPRGSGFGRDRLRQWLEHTRVQLLPKRTMADRACVVVEQTGLWRDPESGEISGEADVASVFRVQDGLVSYYARFDSLSAALDHAGIRQA